jgi:hypothetical protein
VRHQEKGLTNSNPIQLVRASELDLGASILPVGAVYPRGGKTPINFGPAGYVGVGRRWLSHIIESPSEQTDTRIMAAAWVRMTFDGHAHFKRSELAHSIELVNKRTGELAPIKADALNKAIDRLIERGWLSHGSWSRDLIVPGFTVQNGQASHKSTRCPKKPGAPTVSGFRTDAAEESDISVGIAS